MYVREQLVQKYGEALIAKGGLKVTTTLDLDLQNYAQATVAAEVAKLKGYQVSNGRSTYYKASNGEILAMVGSVDYFASPSGNYNVTTALRQPGSSIKPINYAIGLDKHIVTPATMFLDEPTCFAIIRKDAILPPLIMTENFMAPCSCGWRSGIPLIFRQSKMRVPQYGV